MLGINYLAVITAAAAALVEGALWYSLQPAPVRRGVDDAARHGSGRHGRCENTDRGDDRQVCSQPRRRRFQAMAVAGGAIHENYPLQFYAIHAGDALVKTLLMCVILGVWRKASFFGQAGSASRGAE